MVTDGEKWLLDLSYDQWVQLPVSGQKPAARYKHAATIVDEKMYTMGGSRNGRHLSDFQVLDLKKLTWSSIKLNMEANDENSENATFLQAFPATSGHSMIQWGKKLYIVSDSPKNITDSTTVWFIDLESHSCGLVETTGNVPVARSGQSVTLLGSKLIMFGGEDQNRRLLNDVHILDLEVMSWSAVDTSQTPPTPRFDHTAALHADRYLFIFGGCSHSIFFDDLHVLDFETMEWSQPQMQGDPVAARAGHAGIVVGENWFIVGGGDNRSGSRETLVMNLSKLAVSVLLTVEGRDPLASEGISISSMLVNGESFFVTFGGYNGKYSNEVYVIRPKPRDFSLPKILRSPAAAAAAASVSAAYVIARPILPDFIEKEDPSVKVIPVDNMHRDLLVEISSTREGNKVLDSLFRELTADNTAIKTKIEELNSNYSELSKELHSVQGQLVAERSRCAKLEAQIGELQKMLESMESLEKEVQALHTEKSAFDRDLEHSATIQKQRSGGVWKWVSG